MEPTKFFLTPPSGNKLFAWRLTPTAPPMGVICLVHGFGEHSSRYIHWAKKFYQKDYAFVSFDLSGHGASEGKRGHIHSYEQLLDEVECALNCINELYPGIPIILYGHSMGANIAINYSIKRCCMASLLIATSPWLKLVDQPALPLRLLIRLLNHVAPSIQFPSNLDANYISQIPEEVEKYRNDPLVHGSISPRLYCEINKAGEWALKNASSLSIPFLLMHGQADSITSFEKSMELASKIETCSFIPWRAMYHELHHEPVAEKVFNMILEWISGNLEV